MEVIIQPTPKEASNIAANMVASHLQDKPSTVLGLATGSTPVSLYKELIERHSKGDLDFSKVTTFNLDEYVGLSAEHSSSYKSFMHENLFKHINIPKDNINIPDGMTSDIHSYCLEYERKIEEAGGIDIQILGIGTDGHIGFNEPTSSLSSKTRIKTLTERTRADNAGFFADDEKVPSHVITMGIGTILSSKICIVLAFGEKKAQAVMDMIEGPVTAMVPGSALQLHEHVKIIIDEPAASKLEKGEYYKYVYSNKPKWQYY
jgi:glucosamine-6-phosphate deaminase